MKIKEGLVYLVSLILLVAMLPLGALFGSVVTNAEYYGTIVITNNSTTPATAVITNLSLSTPSMIALSFLNSTASDAAIIDSNGNDVAFMPGYGANPWILWAGDMTANQILNDMLYTTNVTGGKIRYFPNTTGATATDNASMEFGNSSNVTFNGVRLDPTAIGGYLINKPSAITVNETATGVLTATAISTGGIESQTANNTSMNLGIITNYWAAGERVNSLAIGSYTVSFALFKTGLPTGTAYVRMVKVSDNSTIGQFGTQDVSLLTTTDNATYYAFNTPVTNPAVQDVYFAFVFNGGTGAAYPSIKYNSANITAYGIFSYYTGGAWIDSPAAELVFKINNIVTTTGTVSTPVLSAAEHDISAWVANNQLAIAVDGTIYATAFTGNVTDNGNAYTLLSNGIAPYVNTITFYQGATQRGSWAWGYPNTSVSRTLTNGTASVTGSPITLADGIQTVSVTSNGTLTMVLPYGYGATVTNGTANVTGSPLYVNSPATGALTTRTLYVNISGAYLPGTLTINVSVPVFYDNSGNGNDLTPSFRTATSDPDVYATLSSFLPVSPADAAITTENTTGTIVTGTPTMPVGMYSENATPGIPFASFINDMLDLGGVPHSFFWFNWAFFIIIAAGILVFKLTNSLLLKAIVMFALMVFFALPGPNIYGMWAPLYFGIDCLTIMILSRHYGW